MASNSLSFQDRLNLGKEKEEDILELLTELVHTNPNGRRVLSWSAGSKSDDINDKIDAWAEIEDADRQSVQIKWRDTGQDLGLSVYRPWTGFDDFKNEVSNERYDRDYKEYPDLYVLSVEQFNMLVIGDGYKCHRIAEILLESLAQEETDPFEIWNSYEAPGKYGAELRLVTDLGEGYTEGQQKLICYIKPFLVEKQNGAIYYYNSF